MMMLKYILMGCGAVYNRTLSIRRAKEGDSSEDGNIFSETFVPSYESAGRYDLKEQYRHIHCRENLKFHII